MIRIIKADNNIKERLSASNDAFCVFDGKALMGVCEYEITPAKVKILRLCCDDNTLKDGLVRQTLNFALDNGCAEAQFDDKIRDELINIGILRKGSENCLNILEFFAKLNGVEIF